MTNLIYLTTALVTNWIPTGDIKREGGTNYHQYRAVVTRQTIIEEVNLCTNRTIYRVGQTNTNGVVWRVVSPVMPPPL